MSRSPEDRMIADVDAVLAKTPRARRDAVPVTLAVVVAHLAAGRPLCTLGLDPRLAIVKQARKLLAIARREKRIANANGDPARGDAMKTRPILFSDEMARALLAGTKTQTRRLVKAPPRDDVGDIVHVERIGDFFRISRRIGLRRNVAWTDDVRCPYGVAGDRLWVRECWRPLSQHTVPVAGPTPIVQGTAQVYDVQRGCAYRADGRVAWFPHKEKIYNMRPDAPTKQKRPLAVAGALPRWRPSIHMPRRYSRVTLEITDVRVQRLQDIEPNDAQAEGIVYDEQRPHDVRRIERCPLVDGYMRLWERINGKGSWGANPWVWAITFKRVDEIARAA